MSRSCVQVIFFLMLQASALRAQSTFGSIVGTVKDGTGASIPAATILVRDLDENTTRKTSSDSQGLFEVLNLKPGRYEVLASKPGFASNRLTQVPIDAREIVRADMKLDVATLSEKVTVAATLAPINTENATISDTKSFRQITELPVNYRGSTTSPLGAILVVPGTTQDVNGNISVGGGLPGMVEYSIDGVSTVNVRSNTPQSDMYPSSEMLSEFKVTSANNNAEFGQMGDVTVTSKGGGNNLHGSAFWYFQNAVLDAATYGATAKPAKVYNTFGGSLSGPVYLPKLYHGRDRTFFFMDYEGNRHPGSTLDQFSVPTAAMRTGNLSGVPGGAAVDPLTGAPFPGNVIPASRINPVASSFFSNYYPLPNFGSGSTVTNLRRLDSTAATTDGYDVRVDHVINSKQQVYGRFSWKDRPYLSPTLLSFDNYTVTSRNLILSHSFTITAHMFNEFRFGLSLWTSLDRFPLDGRNVVSTLGLQGLDLTSLPPGTGGFPGFDFSDGTGFSSVGHPRDGAQRSTNYQFTDNLSWIKGRHTMKFGFDIRALAYHDILHNGTADDFSAFIFSSSAFSGNAFADFLLGLPSTSTHDVLGPNLDQYVKDYGMYAQDEWRISDRVTLNFGLRYQIHPPMDEASGNITNFDPLTGNVIVPDHSLPPSPGFLAGNNACPGTVSTIPCTHIITASQAGIPQGLRFTDYSNWTPRIGLAWRPFGGTKTVVRAGFGVFTETVLGPTAYPFTGVHTSDIRTYTNFQGKGQAPLYTFPQTAAGSFALSPVGTEDFIAMMDLHFKDPRSYQWNFTIEHELPAETLLRLTYLGSNSVGLDNPEDLNQVHASTTPYSASEKPYPQWARLRAFYNTGFANFQSMQVEASHRYHNGLSYQASYSFAKDLGNAGGPIGGAVGGLSLPAEANGGLTITDRFNTRLDRGNLAGVRTNRFLLTGQYELPFGSGRHFLSGMNRVGNAVFGGWNLSTITMLQTGQWQTPTISASLDRSNTNQLGRGVSARPDRIGNGNLSNPTANQYFDITAFTAAPVGSGRFGDSGVGILEGPGTVAVAAGLAKHFMITEKLRLRLEASFRNIPNHPNFNPPAVNTSAPGTFGKLLVVQSQENSGNRSGQIAARFDF